MTIVVEHKTLKMAWLMGSWLGEVCFCRRKVLCGINRYFRFVC